MLLIEKGADLNERFELSCGDCQNIIGFVCKNPKMDKIPLSWILNLYEGDNKKSEIEFMCTDPENSELGTKAGQFGAPPLTIAVVYNNLENVKILIEHGANT